MDGLDPGILYIDVQEKDDELVFDVQKWADDHDIECEVTSLKSGDYAYIDEYSAAIEKKEIGTDAVSSAVNDDLYVQCDNLAETYDYGFLNIIGKRSDVDVTHMNMSHGQADAQFRKAIREVHQSTAIPVNMWPSKSLFVDIGIPTLLSTAEYGFGGSEKLIISRGTKRDPRLNAIIGIPGVGQTKARDALDKFGTVQNVFNARFDELREIFGYKTARKIYNTGRTEWNGESGMDPNHKDGEVWDFLRVSTTNSEPKYDIYRVTDELQRLPDGYESYEELVNEYDDELSEDEIEQMVEAIT